MSTLAEAKAQDRYEAALEAAFGDLAAERRRREEEAARLSGGMSQQAQLCDLILSLAAMLVESRRRKFQTRLQEVEQSRRFQGGTVQEAILDALERERRTKWSADEIRDALDKQGVNATPKEVFNCVDHLIRTKRLKRVSRGQYYDPEAGVAIVTSNEVRTFDIPRGGENEY